MSTEPHLVTLRSQRATVVVDVGAGGRIASLAVDGHELLWPYSDDAGVFGWGSFVMAPYAGRIRHGEFPWNGVVHRLPIAMEPHAIHGTTYDVTWTAVDVSPRHVEMTCEFGSDWPVPGDVTHRMELTDDSLVHVLSARSSAPIPITMGWHPWFRRHLTDGGPEVQWSYDPTGVRMFQRDLDGSTTSTLVDVPDGRVDDCFVGVGTVRVEWPGEFALDVEHDCPVVVLFDGLDHAVCVEPQTGPPDAVRVWPGECIVGPGAEQRATCTWRWRRFG